MTTHDIAAAFANSRPGMTLVDYVEVGLPVWKVLARCDILAPKPISVIDEAIMRALALGVDEPAELQILLGLDEIILETSITSLVGHEWAIDAESGRVALTEAGAAVLDAAKEIVSREVVVEIDYDGLLREPIFHEIAIDRRRALSRGLRELPGAPERAPDVVELRRCKQAIARLLRESRGGREQESQLLAIRSLDRRERHLLPAVALVFAPAGKGRCEVAFVIDDQLAVMREVAFGNASLVDRVGLDRRLRGVPLTPLRLPGPKDLRDAIDHAAESAARERLRELADTAGPDEDPDTATEIDSARRALGAVNPRTVRPHESAQFLDFALASSQRRLLIAGGRLSRAHVEPNLVRRLRQTLERGAMVRIIHEGPVGGQEQALADLEALARDYPGLILEHNEQEPRVLISDNHFAVLGGYCWLSQLGDGTRPIGDHRSVLTSDTERIDSEWARYDGREPGQPPPRETPTRPRRQRARRSRGKPRPRSSGEDAP